MQRTLLPATEAEAARVIAFDDLETPRNQKMELEQVDRGAGIQFDRGADLVTLEGAVAVDGEPGPHPGSPLEEKAGRDDEGERGREDDKLSATECEGGDQAERRQADVRHEPWRRKGRHTSSPF